MGRFQVTSREIKGVNKAKGANLLSLQLNFSVTELLRPYSRTWEPDLRSCTYSLCFLCFHCSWKVIFDSSEIGKKPQQLLQTTPTHPSTHRTTLQPAYNAKTKLQNYDTISFQTPDTNTPQPKADK